MKERMCDAILVMVEENRDIIQEFHEGNFDKLSQFKMNTVRCGKLLALGKLLHSKVGTRAEKKRLQKEIEQLLS